MNSSLFSICSGYLSKRVPSYDYLKEVLSDYTYRRFLRETHYFYAKMYDILDKKWLSYISLNYTGEKAIFYASYIGDLNYIKFIDIGDKFHDYYDDSKYIIPFSGEKTYIAVIVNKAICAAVYGSQLSICKLLSTSAGFYHTMLHYAVEADKVNEVLAAIYWNVGRIKDDNDFRRELDYMADKLMKLALKNGNVNLCILAIRLGTKSFSLIMESSIVNEVKEYFIKNPDISNYELARNAVKRCDEYELNKLCSLGGKNIADMIYTRTCELIILENEMIEEFILYVEDVNKKYKTNLDPQEGLTRSPITTRESYENVMKIIEIAVKYGAEDKKRLTR